MTVADMHIAFRTIGQQMGMQMIRGILPESIDVFLNAAQDEKLNTIIHSHVTTEYKDKVSNQDNDTTLTNSLGVLYVTTSNLTKNSETSYDDYKSVNFKGIPNKVMLVAASVKYSNSNRYYPCRIMERDKVEFSLNDYCNCATDDFPIAVHLLDSVEIYSGKKIANEIKIHYVKNPNRIKYDTDSTKAVDCEFPEHTHIEIVRMAVQLFLQSVAGTSNSQQNQQ